MVQNTETKLLRPTRRNESSDKVLTLVTTKLLYLYGFMNTVNVSLYTEEHFIPYPT